MGQGDSAADAIEGKDEGGAGWEVMAATPARLKGRARVLVLVPWRIEACGHLRGGGARSLVAAAVNDNDDGGGRKQQPLLEAEPVLEMLWHSFCSLRLSLLVGTVAASGAPIGAGDAGG